VTGADELVRSAARAETTGLLLDFDGTIAEIVPRPEDARPLAGMTEVLDALATQLTTVAIVSSRPVSFLRRALGQRSRLLLIGHSGIERESDGKISIVEEARPWIPVVEEAIGTAEETMPPGTTVENKGLALTVHFRQHPERGDEVRDKLATLAERTGLRTRSGKQAMELGIPVPMDKGTVVAEIGGQLQWSAFAGDDSVDVAGFEAIRLLRTERPSLRTFGIGVLSDETPTDVLDAADLTVQGPSGLRDLLRRLEAALDAGRPA
jgi:trehalose 6-phosphate phosphatase